MTEPVADAAAPLPHDMPRWMAAVVAAIDGFSGWVGRIVAWLALPLMLAMAWEIAARYLFNAPTLWAYDVSRMLYGAYFMLGAGYALSKGLHLRADFVYRKFGRRTRGAIDAVLYLALYFPVLVIFLAVSWDFAAVSVVRGERGMDSAWMPLLGPIKSALPLGILLLLVQGVSELLKAIHAAVGGPRGRP